MSTVRHVNQLLALNDVALVESLYITLLNRKPDPEGLEFYVGQLRAGYDKALMIAEFALSPEAESGLALAGLRQYVDAQTRREKSWWRRISRNRHRESQMNRLENSLGQTLQELGSLKQELRVRFDSIEDKFDRPSGTSADSAESHPAQNPDEAGLAGVPTLAWRIFSELTAAVEAIDKPKPP